MSDTIAPSAISFSDPIFDFTFHPSSNLVIAGLITGYVYCYKYDNEENSLSWSTQISKKSCRGVEFIRDGDALITISRDKSIRTLDTLTGRILYKIPKAHKYPINKIHTLDSNKIATGDDEGVIKLWDLRTPVKMIHQNRTHDDFIADMAYCESKSTLLAAGGDGVLSIHDIRRFDKKVATSTILDDELLSLSTIKNDEQVVVGSQSGALYFWDWYQWETIKDKWIGHPSSVDTLCYLDDETICTGGNDGLIRLVSIYPQHQFEGILGDHGEDFPIECLKLSPSSSASTLLGSCGHDYRLRFWNINYLFHDEEDENDDDIQFTKTTKKKNPNGTTIDNDDEGDANLGGTKKRMKQSTNFFNDL
ncbi:WD40-repeat-containing domain protein [Cunninghamella echinulata]|nr:WD40-repeat-containing domain protein [Cunninghamella echinulata]